GDRAHALPRVARAGTRRPRALPRHAGPAHVRRHRHRRLVDLLLQPRVIEAAERFLLAHQRPDGSWWEWDLPPGSSGPWTTAYSAARIHDEDARERAKAWLPPHQHPGGGWGYNASVPADADSTAHAILLLGDRAPAEAVDRLKTFRREDGGFS